MLQAMMAMLAGAGFDKISKGVSNLSQSGTNLQSLMSLPTMPFMLAGAGLKDTANSMDIVQPLMKLMMPPQPPPPPDPKDVNAAMQMMSARLGPGMTGIQAPTGPRAMGMGPQPPAAPMSY